ncbi:MAG TPA: aldolase/citrate lyase family protein, partial [Bryobacteraceae bacterium]|nr:aldolase/citrate lyase family protein [Bryobacteraceae bacterium]
MRKNQVKQALREGKVQLGCALFQMRSPEVPRILKAGGYDWTFIDTEHGPFDTETIQDLCRVSSLVGLCPVVRVADLQYSLIARALDCGAEAILFPRVESPELLETAIAWTKFPPEGRRGFGLTTMHVNYQAMSLPEIMQHVNENVMVVLQIETKAAFDRREELLSVPGIDVVMVGPADLSISLGVPGDFLNPKMVETMEAIRETCLAKGIIPGTHTRDVAVAKFWKE